MTRAIVLSLLATLCGTSLAAAQNREPTPPATQYLLQRLSNNTTLDRYLQNIRQDFRQLDADRDGEIKTADIAVHATITGAMASTMFAIAIMRADLDGDGAVTEGEMRQLLTYERRTSAPPVAADSAGQEQIDRQVREFMAADTNHDGRITYEETIAYSKNQSIGDGTRRHERRHGEPRSRSARAGP